MLKRTIHFGNPAHLYTRNRQLMVDLKNETRDSASIPIEDIGTIVLEHPQITLTAALLEQLLDNKVAVVSCNSKFMPCGLFLPLDANSEQTERIRIQLEASTPLKKQLWQQTIKAKIANQAALLDLIDQPSERLRNLREKVLSGDTGNCEAQAASFYWDRIYGSKFVRSRDPETPNAQMNYGYAILRSIVARALIASGMLPTVGIHHKNKYNAYCLADDVMEPYRPYVDLAVLNLPGLLEADGLSKGHKTELLRLPQMDVVIGGLKRPLVHAVSHTTASLYRCFSGEQRKVVYPDL